MATASDFASWAVPDLVIPLGGRTFTVQPPSVDDMGKLLACAVRGEVNLGIVEGHIPDEVQEILDTIGSDEHPALGAAYHEMREYLHPVTLDRMARSEEEPDVGVILRVLRAVGRSHGYLAAERPADDADLDHECSPAGSACASSSSSSCATASGECVYGASSA